MLRIFILFQVKIKSEVLQKGDNPFHSNHEIAIVCLTSSQGNFDEQVKKFGKTRILSQPASWMLAGCDGVRLGVSVAP